MCNSGWDQNLQDGVIKGHIDRFRCSAIVILSTGFTFVWLRVEPQHVSGPAYMPDWTHSSEQFLSPARTS